jgi:hypothetical protein
MRDILKQIGRDMEVANADAIKRTKLQKKLETHVVGRSWFCAEKTMESECLRGSKLVIAWSICKEHTN